MKRVLLSSAAVLMSLAGYAQNTATVTQNGTSQTATANQSGSNLTATVSQVGTPTSNSSNQGLSFQTGSGHVSTINQNNGSLSNRAGITQTNSSGVGSNSATISQSNGSGGAGLRGGDPATAVGSGNWTGILQQGSGNRATLTQDGANTTRNFAEAYQYGTNNGAGSTGPVSVNQNGATDGRAEIRQGSSLVAVANNGATVDQTASSTNDAFITQLSNSNRAEVRQTGTGSTSNTATVQQGSGNSVSGETGNSAYIEQYSGVSSGNQATIFQTSINGDAVIQQVNSTVNSIGLIRQIAGTGSFARVAQNGGVTSTTGIVTQYANSSNGYIYQENGVTNGLATITQGSASIIADGDDAFIYQNTGSTSSTATITQNTTAAGGNNDAQIIQGLGTANIATIIQQGSSNMAGVQQTGSVSASGSNTATITQTGDFNVVDGPGPGGPRLAASAVQNGSGNRMTVTQDVAAGVTTSMSFRNLATLSQTGTGNTLTVDQDITSGMSGNTAIVTQNGMMNQAFVQQNGTTVTP